VTKIEMTFYCSGRWESGCPGRVASSGGVDLMLQFWLERERRCDEALSEDETDAANSSWLHGKEV
jgi:hypothetical protein